jgi:hypothetical protein
VLLLEECMMLVLTICCCRAVRAVAGVVFDTVGNHLLLQALHVLLLEECMMLLLRRSA